MEEEVVLVLDSLCTTLCARLLYHDWVGGGGGRVANSFNGVDF